MTELLVSVQSTIQGEGGGETPTLSAHQFLVCNWSGALLSPETHPQSSCLRVGAGSLERERGEAGTRCLEDWAPAGGRACSRPGERGRTRHGVELRVTAVRVSGNPLHPFLPSLFFCLTKFIENLLWVGNPLLWKLQNIFRIR